MYVFIICTLKVTVEKKRIASIADKQESLCVDVSPVNFFCFGSFNDFVPSVVPNMS